MSQLEDIRAFVEVLESGGFSRAAKRLGLSKSVVSRRVSRLEAELGSPLLSRTTRGIGATEAGMEYKLRAEAILLELEEARQAVARHGEAVVGRLRLSLPLGFGLRHLAPLVAELALRHPKLEVEASYSDRIVDIIGERLDAAVRIGDLKDSSLVARKIATGRAIAVASPAYLAARGRPERPEEIERHHGLIYTGSSDREWRFQVEGRWVGVRPDGRIRADSGEALIAAAVAGLGVAAVPAFLASDAIVRGQLEPLLTDFPMPAFGIYVVRPPGTQVPGKLRVFIDLLVQRFGGEPHWDPCQMARRGVAAGADG